MSSRHELCFSNGSRNSLVNKVTLGWTVPRPACSPPARFYVGDSPPLYFSHSASRLPSAETLPGTGPLQGSCPAPGHGPWPITGGGSRGRPLGLRCTAGGPPASELPVGPTPGRAQDSAWPRAAAQSPGGAVQHSLLWGVTRWCGQGCLSRVLLRATSCCLCSPRCPGRETACWARWPRCSDHTGPR